jgi:DNA-directed RNA polymerase sigma subunit (sigma70/sigma32)
MNKFFALKPKKVKELLKTAKPVMTIFSAINNLKKKIAEKEKNLKKKKIAPEEIKKLKIELKEREKELKKMGEEKVAKGVKAINFLIHHNQNFVKYLAKGYSFFSGRVDLEELTSEGISSLPKAIEKFNLNIDSTFPTYSGI